MRKHFRFRNLALVGGSLGVLAMLFFTDPNGGAMTGTVMLQIAMGLIAVGFAHLGRKALFDYINMGDLYRKAKETSTGAAITFAGICLVIFGLLGLFGGQAHAADHGEGLGKPSPNSVVSFVPANARGLLPTLKAANKLYWPDHPNQLT